MRIIDHDTDMSVGLGHAPQQPLQPIPQGDNIPMSDPDRPSLAPPKPHDQGEPSAEPVEPDQK